MRTLLALCLIAILARAETYVFDITPWPSPIVGYLDTNVGRYGLGALYFGGFKWPLTEFDQWWKIGLTDEDAHMCLVIHPYAPWIVGILTWQGMKGSLDLLSSDWTWWEFSVEVRTEIGDRWSKD